MPTLEEIRKQFEAQKKAQASAPAPEPTPAPAPGPAPAPKAAPTPAPSTATRPKPPAVPTATTKPATKPATPGPKFKPSEPMSDEEKFIASLPPEKQQAVRDLDRLKAEADARPPADRPVDELARRAQAAMAASGARAPAKSTPTEIAKGAGMLAKPVVAEVIRAATEGVPAQPGVRDPVLAAAESAAREVEASSVRDAQERQKQAEEDRQRATARFEARFGNDPELLAARELADKLRSQETPQNKKSLNNKFLSEYRQEYINKEVAARGGPDAITSGPEMAEIERRAHDKAIAALTNLRTTGQWHIPLTPDEVSLDGPGPKDWRAFLPKQEVRPDGRTVRTEGLASWFMSVPMSALDAGALAAMQGVGGDIEDRDFVTRYLDNVAGRQDMLSYRIENDPELQADLSSGDPARVRSALKTLGPFAALTLLTPDPITAGAGVATAGKRAAQFGRYGGTLAQDLKAAETVGEKVKVLEQAGKKFDEMDKAGAEALRADKGRRRAEAAISDYRSGASFDDVADKLEKVDPAVAVVLRDRRAGAVRSDPDVAMYLDYERDNGLPDVDFSAPRAVEFTPTDEARRADIQTRIRAIDDLIDEQTQAFRAGLGGRGEGVDEGELRRLLEVPRRQKAALRDELLKLADKEQAAQGYAKLRGHLDNVERQVIDDLERQVSGDVVPSGSADKFAPQPPKPTPPVVDEDALVRVFGEDVKLSEAERIAAARTPEDLVKALSKAAPSVREAVAAKLGFDDYGALKEAAKVTDDATRAQLDKVQAELATLRAEVMRAADRAAALRAAPGQAEARRALKAAEAEVADAEKELARAVKAAEPEDTSKLDAADEKLAAADAKGQQNVKDLEKKLADRIKGKETEEQKEIAKIESELRKYEEDASPNRTKPSTNGKQIPTTGESERLARLEYDDAKKAVDAFDAETQRKLDALSNERAAALRGKTSKAKKADADAKLTKQMEQVQAEAKAARAPLDERLAEADKALNGYGTKTTKDNKGWAKKLAGVQAYLEQRRQFYQPKLDELRAKVAEAPEHPDIAEKKAYNAELVAKAREKHEASMAKLRAKVAEERAKVAERRRVRDEELASAQARAADARRAFDEAQSKYGAVPEPATRTTEGPAYEEKVLKADQARIAAQRKYAERLALAMEIEKNPSLRMSLEKALADTRPEMQAVAGQLRAREDFLDEQMRIARRGEPPNPVIHLARTREDFLDELDFLDRELRREKARARGTLVFNTIAKNLRYFMRPYSEIQEASLTDPLRRLVKRLDGEALDIGERLARAGANAQEGTDDINRLAFAAVESEVHHFKASVLERQIPSEYAGEVISAFLQPNVKLAPEQVAPFNRLLVDWAADPESTVDDLRNGLLTLTRSTVGEKADETILRVPQIADVLLANSMGQAGALRRMMLDMGFGVVTAKGAEQINNVLTDLHKLGGNPRADIGRQRLLRMVIDADDYRPRLVDWTSTARRPEVMAPVSPAYKKAALPGLTPEQKAARAIEQADGIAAEVADLFANELYVPHAVRDAIQSHLDAVVATGRLTAQYSASAALDYWRQAVIVGVGLSMPRQGYMDHIGDILQIATKRPGVAASVAARSTLSQPLNFYGAAQLSQLADFRRKAPPGTSARDFDRFVGRASFSPDVQRILDRSTEMVGDTGMTGAEHYRLVTEEGLFETLLTGQLTRTLALHGTRNVPRPVAAAFGAAQGAGLGLVLGGPMGAVVGALGGSLFGLSQGGRKLADANHAALVDLANITANRRRAALYVSLVNRGVPPTEAAREAVKMVGAFSREVSPVERAVITWWYPFYAYRKFNTRRALSALTNPYFMKGINEAGNQGVLALNAFFDDTDEYGLHTGPMNVEPDPELYFNLIQQVKAQHPDWTDEQVYQEVDDQAEGLPRAIERYERLLPALREMDLYAARRHVLESEDWRWLVGPYWSPDPVKSNLPEWLQDRYTVVLNRARSQDLETYFRAGVGRNERKSDEIRYFSGPPDPNLDGIQTAMLALAAATTMAGLAEGSAGADLVGIAIRDPNAQSVLEIANVINPDELQDTAIPRAVGENLLAAGLGDYVRLKTPLGEPVDPADPAKAGVRDVRYYIPAEKSAHLYLASLVFRGALAGIQVQQARDALFGTDKVVGEADAVDDFGAYTNFFLQQPVRTTYPGMEGMVEDKNAERRIEAATPRGLTMPQEQPATTLRRAWSSVEAQPDFEERAARVVEAAKTRRVDPRDVLYLRALLARRLPPEEVAAMSNIQVVKEFASGP